MWNVTVCGMLLYVECFILLILPLPPPFFLLRDDRNQTSQRERGEGGRERERGMEGEERERERRGWEG